MRYFWGKSSRHVSSPLIMDSTPLSHSLTTFHVAGKKIALLPSIHLSKSERGNKTLTNLASNDLNTPLPISHYKKKQSNPILLLFLYSLFAFTHLRRINQDSICFNTSHYSAFRDQLLTLHSSLRFFPVVHFLELPLAVTPGTSLILACNFASRTDKLIQFGYFKSWHALCIYKSNYY